MNDLPIQLIENPILVLWVLTKGQRLQKEDCDFWKNLAQENQQNIKQRLIIESGEDGAEEVDGVPVIDFKNMGFAFNQIAKEAPWETIWFVPVGINLQEVVGDYHRFSLGRDLDAITFYRNGGKSPIIRRLFYWLIKKPLFFLLEIPSEIQSDWLGWNNWFWEKLGSWLFAVPNRDPFFPLRMIKGEWFRRIPFQSTSGWIWLEMLAKLHFLGAKLSEKPVENHLAQVNVISGWRAFQDFRLVLTKPNFRMEP